jgi:hypothetical protein
MRQTVIATAAVLAAIIIALFGGTFMTADAPQKAQPAATSGSIDIMQMMRDTKALPVEQFDAN